MAKIIKVGSGNEYASIKMAIQAAHPDDTVWVGKAVYKEKNILITKPLTLLGDQWPVLDGEHRYEIITINANNVRIKGFKLIHSGVSSLVDIAGIRIFDSRQVEISNNIFDDTFFGVYVQSGILCRIENNQFTAYSKTEQKSGNGIHCWKCDSMYLINNSISGHRDGIYFEFVTNSIIWKNNAAHNIRYGLHFMFSHNDDYLYNRFSNNGAGVSVMFSHGVKMVNNIFADNWGDGAYGLLLKEISDSYVVNNIFSNNTSAVFMEGASRVKMYRNEFKSNGWGLKIQASCMDISVSWNNFIGNSFDVGTNGFLVLNNFDHNYWDKYEGYDLGKDGIGDIPFHPVSLFSMVVEKNPTAMMLFRSVMTGLLDKTERILPSLTPENLKDNYPYMKPLKL
jgi:nitrous oxidase accessory protein